MTMTMNTMTLPLSSSLPFGTHGNGKATHSESWYAMTLTVAVHVVVFACLLWNWTVAQPPVPQVKSIKVAMIAMPPAVVPATVSATMLPPVQKTPAPVEQAELAHKRIDKKIPEIVREKPQPTVPDRAVEERQKKDNERQENERQATEARLADEQRQRDAAAEASRQEAARQEALKQDALKQASRQYLPIEKQAPAYPSRALEKGIEGSCTVSYTVNASGRVEQPQVAGECNPLFIRPSLEAAKGFRYEPRIVDGKAVAVPNVKNTFQYRIEP